MNIKGITICHASQKTEDIDKKEKIKELEKVDKEKKCSNNYEIIRKKQNNNRAFG